MTQTISSKCEEHLVPRRGPDVVVALLQSKNNPEHYLVQRRLPTNKQYANYLEFPGGKKEEGETKTNALYREIFEEVGVTISDCRIFASIDFLFPTNIYHNVHFYEVPAKDYSGEPKGVEEQRVGWLTLYQIMTYPKMLPLNRAAALILTTQKYPDILID